MTVQPADFLAVFGQGPAYVNPTDDKQTKPLSATKMRDILTAAATDAKLKVDDLPFFKHALTSTLNPISALQHTFTCFDIAKARGDRGTWASMGKAVLVLAGYLAGAALTALAVQLAVSSIFYLVTGNVLGFAVATNASIAIDSLFVGAVASKVASFTACVAVFGFVTNWIANDQFELSCGKAPEGFQHFTKFFTTIIQPFANAYNRVAIAKRIDGELKARAEEQTDTIATFVESFASGKSLAAVRAALEAAKDKSEPAEPAKPADGSKPAPADSKAPKPPALDAFKPADLKAAFATLETLETKAKDWRSARVTA